MPNGIVLLAIITVTILITGTAGYMLPTSLAGVAPPPDTCEGKCEATFAKKISECGEKEIKCENKQAKKNAKCEKKCKGNEACLDKCDIKNTEKMEKCKGEIPKCEDKAMDNLEKCEGKCDPPLDVRKKVVCTCEGGLTIVPCTDDTPELLEIGCTEVDKLDELCSTLCDGFGRLGSFQPGTCQATDVCGA